MKTTRNRTARSALAFLLVLAALLCTLCLSACDDDAPEIDYGTDDGTSSSTVLIYMIGSDLESESGCATLDLKEMCGADLGDRANVVIQAGGAKKWHNKAMKNGSTQRVEIANGKINVVDDLGKQNMTKQQNLADFIKWGVQNYPATNYDLILWDHGGGTLLGFGCDEYYEDEMLELDEISAAIKDSGAHFGFVGFDACLMGTVETATALSPYADYLIASEETEPGTGWYYTEWLNALGQNPGISSKELGKKIVHDFVNGPDSTFWDDTTLSVVDLSKISNVYQNLVTYFAASDELLRNQGYKQIATARSKAKAFGEGSYEQIDIVDYLGKLGIDGSSLTESIKDAVAYSESSVSSASGLAMYFPYDAPEYYDKVLKVLKNAGVDDASHQQFFNDFVSVMVTGQYSASSTDTAAEQLTETDIAGQETTADTEQGEYDDSSWYQDDAQSDSSDLAQGGIAPIESDDVNVDNTSSDTSFKVTLSDEQWDEISYIDRQVYLDDGTGFIDLGYDSEYEIDENDNVVMDFDRTWYTVGGRLAAYKIAEEGQDSNGNDYRFGYASAVLNGKEEVDVQIYFDDDNPDGIVTGYRTNKQSGVLSLFSRNLRQFEEGDTIRFYFTCFTYDGETDEECYLDDALTYDGSNLTVSMDSIGSNDAYVSAALTDIFNTQTWSDPVKY